MSRVVRITRDGQIDQVLREGLGFDRCEVAVVTNVGSGDHLGLNYITTVEDLAVLKRVVVQNVAPTGYAVLNAADPILEITPESVDVVPDRRDHTEARNNDSAIFHQREPIPTLCTVWKSLPSVLMEGAMMISVC